MLSEEESAERMDDVDEDEDGYVTWAEYISETYGINDPDDQKLLEKEDQAEEQRVRRRRRWRRIAMKCNEEKMEWRCIKVYKYV